MDLVSIGELLIDFTPVDGAEETYRALPGGAPANVVCAAQVHGLQTAFIGAVGNDHFGELLKETLCDRGVDISGVETVDEAFTTLAFVSLDEEGERDFSFARKPGADQLLELGLAQRALLEKTRVLHYGTISLSDEPARSATREAVEIVKEAGGLVSFDPNLRPALWASSEALLEQVRWGLAHCDILKISDDDLAQMDARPHEQVVEEYLKSYDLELVLLSQGARGASAYWLDSNAALQHVFAPSDEGLKVVDTTGAGDIFTGVFLSKLLPALHAQAEQVSAASFRQVFSDWLLTAEGLRAMLESAVQMAGLSTTKHGGIPSIPS